MVLFLLQGEVHVEAQPVEVVVDCAVGVIKHLE